MSQQRQAGFLSEGTTRFQIKTDEHPEGLFFVKERYSELPHSKSDISDISAF